MTTSTGTKAAIVTGAGSNVGQRIAIALLHDGYSVTLAGRRLEALESTVAQAGEAGRRLARRARVP